MTRASWTFLFIILFIIVGALHAGESWIPFFATVILDGGLATLWIACAAILGLTLLKFLPLEIPTSLRFATSAALGLGIYSLAALGLGLAGILNRWTALSFPILSLVFFCIREIPKWRTASPSLLRQRAESWLNHKTRQWWPWLLPISVLAAASVAATMPPGMLWKSAGDPHPYDVLEYHLQVPREWQESGRITPLKHNVYCFFPANVEMQYLLVMHLAGNAQKAMYIAHFITLGYAVLAVIALYSAARSLSPQTSPTTAALAAAAMACVPWIAMLGSVAYNESGLLLYVTLALTWIIRALLNPQNRKSAFALAGLMAGFACGVKYTAVPIVAVLFLLLLFFPWRLARLQITSKEILAACALFALTASLTFSPWLLRNLHWTGNPVFPEAMNLLGRGHFTQDQQQRWERAHRPTPDQSPSSKRLSAFAREIFADQRYGYAFFPAILFLALLTRWTIPGIVSAILLLALAIFWLALTHLQSRFFIVAIPFAALLLAQQPRSRLTGIIQTISALIISLTGCLLLHTILYQELDQKPAIKLLIGLQNLSLFHDQPIQNALKNSPCIALVGDARAFLYPLPPSCLHYRTVFDVDLSSDKTLIDAWLGPDADRLKRECTLIVDQDELDRMLATYILGRPWSPPPRPRGMLVLPPRP